MSIFDGALTFKERLKLERSRRVAREYDVGAIYALGKDNRVTGHELVRDKVLGREVRMDLTATRPHIKLIPHPEALEANQADPAKVDPRWTVASKEGEFRCPLCGAAHPNPSLAHSYRSCFRCSGVLTLPGLLHKEVFAQRKKEAEERARAAGSAMAGAEGWRPDPLYVLAASLGAPNDAGKAYDAAPGLRLRIRTEKGGTRGVLELRRGEHLPSALGMWRDPHPGEPKLLRIRYELVNVNSATWQSTATQGEVRVSVPADGVLTQGFTVANPTGAAAMVKVGLATFGHPLGARKGRGAFDVSEQLQGLVDQTDGQFLEISHSEDIYKLFDDPSPGMPKQLVVEYELMGVGDSNQEDEMRDVICRPLGAKIAPKFAPLIIIKKASFGVTPQGAAKRRKLLQKALYEISVLTNRRAQRLYVKPEDLRKLDLEESYRRELEALHPTTVEVGSVDVTDILQRIVDGAGEGKRLLIPEGTDLIDLLGLHDAYERATTVGPMSAAERAALAASMLSRCKYKLLEVDYVVTGHDADQKTSSDEVTSSGFDRNFIRYTEGTGLVFTEDVGDDFSSVESGRAAPPAAVLRSRLDLQATTVFPTMKIEYALYGHHTNPRRQIDIKSEMETLVENQGRDQFTVDRSMNLQKLFKVNPLRGYRKMLRVGYVARGLSGTLRLPDKDGRLVADLFVGYPAKPPTPRLSFDDDEAEKLAVQWEHDQAAEKERQGQAAEAQGRLMADKFAREEAVRVAEEVAEEANRKALEAEREAESQAAAAASNRNRYSSVGAEVGDSYAKALLDSREAKAKAREAAVKTSPGGRVLTRKPVARQVPSHLRRLMATLVEEEQKAAHDLRERLGPDDDASFKAEEGDDDEGGFAAARARAAGASLAGGRGSAETPLLSDPPPSSSPGTAGGSSRPGSRGGSRPMTPLLRPRRSEGGLLGRRVVISGTSKAAVNGLRGKAVKFTEGQGRYAVLLDPKGGPASSRLGTAESKEGADDAGAAAEASLQGDGGKGEGGQAKALGSKGGGGLKAKYLQVLWRNLEDEKGLGAWAFEPEEDDADKAKRLAKERRKAERKKAKLAARPRAGLLPAKAPGAS
mmetsp:Transcript_7656/g.17496  ORF Transcript_7656/g.17496 Transcript_7656/m.17496 type:complete len:1090 (-) Transcript_7656:8-3277(-)